MAESDTYDSGATTVDEDDSMTEGSIETEDDDYKPEYRSGRANRVHFNNLPCGQDEETVTQASDNDDEVVSRVADNEVDEYEAFRNDRERYRYDQQCFSGLEKAKTPRRQQVHKKGNPPATAAASSKIKKETETPTKSRLGKQPPLKNDIRIDFDAKGRLWYSYLKDVVEPDGNRTRVYICERAIFHHWIRAALSKIENSKGSYDFPNERQSGLGKLDKTCFNDMQRKWGLTRDHYAPVMFEYENLRRSNPGRTIGNLYHRKCLVIDYWLGPVRDFREIPLVISSKIAGGFIEPAMRIRSEISYRDIKARMPPFMEVEGPGDGRRIFKPVYDHNTISNRARRFREQAGAISWKPEPSSAYVKKFMDTCPSQVARSNNSTKACTDLSVAELRALRMTTAMSAPEKARKSSTIEGRTRYKIGLQKLARDSPVLEIARAVSNTIPKPSSQEELSSNQNRMTSNPGPAIKRKAERSIGQDILPPEAKPTVSKKYKRSQTLDHAPTSTGALLQREYKLSGGQGVRHYVYLVQGPAVVNQYTREAAANDPDVDLTDPRHHFPTSQMEIDALQEALKPTMNGVVAVAGYWPITSQDTSYIHQYFQIQSQFLEAWIDTQITAPCLPRRGRWSGGILDWRSSAMGPPDEPKLWDWMAYQNYTLGRFEDHSQHFPRRQLLPLEAAPVTEIDRTILRRLLKPTQAHLAWFTGEFVEKMGLDSSYNDEWDNFQDILDAWFCEQRPSIGDPEPQLLRLLEFNAQRAVWSMPWEAKFGKCPNLDGIVRAQLSLETVPTEVARWKKS